MHRARLPERHDCHALDWTADDVQALPRAQPRAWQHTGAAQEMTWAALVLAQVRSEIVRRQLKKGSPIPTKSEHCSELRSAKGRKNAPLAQPPRRQPRARLPPSHRAAVARCRRTALQDQLAVAVARQQQHPSSGNGVPAAPHRRHRRHRRPKPKCCQHLRILSSQPPGGGWAIELRAYASQRAPHLAPRTRGVRAATHHLESKS